MAQVFPFSFLPGHRALPADPARRRTLLWRSHGLRDVGSRDLPLAAPVYRITRVLLSSLDLDGLNVFAYRTKF